MFNRIRRLNISLAAKCQLLFGAAVVLIISAALFVPWQRMEQLTEQLNETSATAVAEATVRMHLFRGYQTVPKNPATHPVEEISAEPTTRPTSSPTLAPPRLIALNVKETSPMLGSFDRRALAEFRRDPDTRTFFRYYERKDGSSGYRLALPLRLRQDCLRCHSADAFGVTAPATQTLATTQAGVSPWPLVGLVSVDISSQIRSNQLLLNRVFILTAGMLAGTLAIVVFYLITTRLILQPVRVLQETAEKVSQGDLNIRSDISTGDEFQQLSETFNTMLVNLKNSADQLRAMNKSLDLKIGQLAESNVALYESNRLKSEFLANVSHELRTPLNSILGFAELLKESAPPVSLDGKDTNAKSARYLQNILQSGRNLLELINDLLDLAKIEAGRMDVRSEPLSLTDVFEGLTSLLKPLTEPKELTIVAGVSAEVPILQTDPAKLQQILYNFLSNAIKFSPAGEKILLTAVMADESRVRISVLDTGPGIEPDKHAVIFEKFRQIDGSVTRQHSGTGLGLAISKEMTLLLGGTIGIQSTPGEGSTFWIELPIKILAGAQDLRAKMVFG